MRSIARKTSGVLCIAAGCAFGLLPFVPGILLVIVGAELLGIRERAWERIKSFGRRKEGKGSARALSIEDDRPPRNR